MALPDVLHSLLSAHGPSGYETAPAAIWRDAAGAFAEVTTDHMGNSYATVKGTGDGLSLAIVGHVDEIGLIVTHIDDQGFLYFGPVGGWDPAILIGQRVSVTTRDGVLPGVVGKKPIHLIKPDERDKGTKLTELHIDIGAKDGDEARGLVRIGDTAVITGDPVELPNGRAISRAMDNRLGAFVAYEAARLVAEAGGSPGDVVGVAAVQEEIGLNGARAAAFTVRPDVAIVVDVTHATDAPGVDAKELGEHKLGSGPVIERGSILNPAVFELLHEIAEADGIPFTVAASGRGTGTDADVVHMSRGGIPTTVIGLPLRYMHSPVEMVAVDDVLNAAKLIAAFAQRLTAGTSFAR
ncbi:MAG: family metallopeptidase [Solirubrobacterales bacterium]|jgi:putative aminopeptidase FrvX|nr:family metallopeptidase [Solirubrobacterales bacterium]